MQADREALAIAEQKFAQQNLDFEKKKHESQAMFQEDLAAQHQRCQEKIQQEKDRWAQEFETQIGDYKKQEEERLNLLKKTFLLRETKRLEEENQTYLRQEKERHDGELAHLKARHENEISEENKKFQAELSAEKKRLETLLGEAKAESQNQLEKLRRRPPGSVLSRR